MKAIETVYNGYRFRSRLEARWAVFFDTMGIEYQYEAEGFEIDHGNGEVTRYLPDFYFPKSGMFAEVKGANTFGGIDENDAERMSWMVDFGGPCSAGIILLGDIPFSDTVSFIELAAIMFNGKGIDIGYFLNADVCSYLMNKFPPYYENYYPACELDDQKVDRQPTMKIIDRGSAPWAPYNDKTKNARLTHTVMTRPGNSKHILHDKDLENALRAARSARFEHGEAPNVRKRH